MVFILTFLVHMLFLRIGFASERQLQQVPTTYIQRVYTIFSHFLLSLLFSEISMVKWIPFKVNFKQIFQKHYQIVEWI